MLVFKKRGWGVDFARNARRKGFVLSRAPRQVEFEHTTHRAERGVICYYVVVRSDFLFQRSVVKPPGVRAEVGLAKRYRPAVRRRPLGL